MRHPGPEVGRERRQRARQLAEVVDHPAAVDVAHVDVHVPVAVVDGGHLQADVGLDEPGDVGERVPEVGVRVHGAVRRHVGPGVLRSGRRPRARRARRARAAQHVGRAVVAARAAPCPSASARRRRTRRSARRSRSTTSRARGSGRGTPTPRATMPICTPWNSLSCRRVPSSRSIQPVRSPEPGAARSISSIAAKWERLGSDIPTAWTAAEGLVGPEGLERRHRRVHPERRVELPQGVRRDADAGPPRAVVGVARPARSPAGRRTRHAATARRARRR